MSRNKNKKVTTTFKGVSRPVPLKPALARGQAMLDSAAAARSRAVAALEDFQTTSARTAFSDGIGPKSRNSLADGRLHGGRVKPDMTHKQTGTMGTPPSLQNRSGLPSMPNGNVTPSVNSEKLTPSKGPSLSSPKAPNPELLRENTCKPRPDDTAPKGAGGGGKPRRFVPWCS